VNLLDYFKDNKAGVVPVIKRFKNSIIVHVLAASASNFNSW
jgi:hypothetical protein